MQRGDLEIYQLSYLAVLRDLLLEASRLHKFKLNTLQQQRMEIYRLLII